MPPKNAKRNEKDRKRRADGLLRHQQDLAEKQEEIDHLHGSLTGVLGQLANFEGVADIIRDYQKSVQPWDDDEPVDLMYCRGCGGRGIRAEMEIARLTAICRKSDCGRASRERACSFARADRNSGGAQDRRFRGKGRGGNGIFLTSRCGGRNCESRTGRGETQER